MNNWLYQGRTFEPPEEFTPDVWYGFVYCITNRAKNKKYVGKKFFWKAKTLPITKKRKRRQRLKVESDWRTYYGSNKRRKRLYGNNRAIRKRSFINRRLLQWYYQL